MIYNILGGVFDAIIFSYLLYISVYNLVLSLAGLKNRLIDLTHKPSKLNKFLVLIPCYRDYQVILETAQKAIDQDYPSDFYEVVIIADSIPVETISDLNKIPVKVLEVSFDKSTKVKALNKALDSNHYNADALIILDADNLMEREYLRKFNIQFDKGTKIIQGQRLPRVSSSEVAFLDGLSEKINNHIFRKGSNNLGLSSSIAGSGFGGDYLPLRNTLKGMNSVGGFDKELEILLLEQGLKTEYFENLVVYEEKVENISVFKNQRKRWISSQYFYLRKYYTLGVYSLLKGRLSLFNSIILRNVQLPRLLNFGILPFIIFYYTLIPNSAISIILWNVLTCSYFCSIALALPKDFYTLKNIRAILKLPGLLLVMLKLLFSLRGANAKFIHTPKGAK